MKKLSALLAAGFALSAMALTSAAIDYAVDPDYQFDEDDFPSGVIPSDDIEEFYSNKDVLYVSITENTALSLTGIQRILNANAPALFRGDGYAVKLDPLTYRGNDFLKPFSLFMRFGRVGAAGETSAGETVPANSLTITPASHGDFPFTIELNISRETLAVMAFRTDYPLKLHYVNNSGHVSLVNDNVRFNADGSVNISFSSASYYFLSQDAPPITTTPHRPSVTTTTTPEATEEIETTDDPPEEPDEPEETNPPITTTEPPTTTTPQQPQKPETTPPYTAAPDNWWSFGSEVNPSTNVVVGAAGLLILAGAGVLVLITRKK